MNQNCYTAISMNLSGMVSSQSNQEYERSMQHRQTFADCMFQSFCQMERPSFLKQACIALVCELACADYTLYSEHLATKPQSLRVH